MTARLGAILLAGALFLPAAVAAAEPAYVGGKYCRNCHAATDRNRYHLWMQTRHAKAFDVLQGAERLDGKCLACHATGYGKPMADQTAEKDLRGVQCEACHGPGSDYKGMKIMKDPKLAKQNGLWVVTREVCLRCHR